MYENCLDPACLTLSIPISYVSATGCTANFSRWCCSLVLAEHRPQLDLLDRLYVCICRPFRPAGMLIDTKVQLFTPVNPIHVAAII